jgi:5'(3')-deoxyribonucleotidase/predicted kinase
MLHFSEFNEITDKLTQLDEKMIVIGGGKKYGQIVFLAGGAGSGKGFARDNFLDAGKFKIRDVDELKQAFLTLRDKNNLYPELKGLDLAKPKDVFKLHKFVKEKGIKDRTLDLLLTNAKEGRLPNIMFDCTLSEIEDITGVLPELLKMGYQPRDIHVVWVLTSYHIAVQQNKSRPRIVPDDILLKTHEGAARTMFELLSGKIPNGVNGGVYVILGGAKHSVFYTDPKTGKPLDGRDGRILIKDFKYLKMKDPGKKMADNALFNSEVLNWIKGNVPKTKKTKEIFGSGQDLITKLSEEVKLPEIYCDMDGVLCDFIKGASEVLGHDFRDSRYFDKEGRDKKVELTDKEPNLFRKLDWMPDGESLYRFISKYNPTILSAYATWMPKSPQDKRTWLGKNTRVPRNKMFMVQRHQKRDYAIKNGERNILIDDHPKNIKEWEQAGGIGIHHTTASNTIRRLKSLGF